MKMASTSNGSGGKTGSGCSRNIEGLVDSSCKKVVKGIVKEINENKEFFYVQFSGLDEDIELLQKTMESLCIDMMSLKQKVEKIEIKVETTILRVLK